MKTTIRSLLTGLATLALLAACSPSGGLNATSSSGLPAGGNDSQSGGGGGGGSSDPLKDVDLKGYISGGTYESKQTFDLNTERGELIVRLPLGVDSTILIGSGSIPQLPGVTFYTAVETDGTYSLVLNIPVRYFLRGVSTLPASRLPNGDPLPLMPAGELPSVAVALNANAPTGKKVYLYIGVDAIAVFVESKWLTCAGLPICLNLTFPVKNQTKTKVVGYFSMIMPKGDGKDGGFFISTIIPSSVARILDDYFLN